jgi:hypothetical protein
LTDKKIGFFDSFYFYLLAGGGCFLIDLIGCN